MRSYSRLTHLTHRPCLIHLTHRSRPINPAHLPGHHPARPTTPLRATTTAFVTLASLITLATTASATTPTTPTTPTTSATAPAPRCTESALAIKATVLTPQRPDALRISATNRTDKPCTVDRIPTVTFGDLDGAAEPDPPTESAPYRLAPGSTAYATVRTVTGRPTPPIRTVDFLTVAADPSHHGRRFDVTAIGAPPTGIRVWSPTTTWWSPTPA